MENRYKISYDIKQKNIVNISFMQGDVDTSVIEIQLFDNEQVVDITGETIEFRFLKPDNTIVAQDSTTGVNIISASEGKFECILMANTLAVPGVVRTEIVRKKNNFILTCPTFYFTVKSSIGNTILSSNYIASIENKMIEWQLNEDLRQERFENNETNRQSIFETNEANRQEIFETNEQNRQSNEVTRIENEDIRKSNELERINNEADRISNELARQSNEAARIANENERIANEEARQTNEQNRETAETARDTAEAIRANNEAARIAAENNRNTAEQARIEAENTREANEATRQSNESARQEAEAARVSAEDDRASAEQDRITEENKRIENEAIRQSNEEARIEAEQAREERMAEVENNVKQHELKILKVEKDINDYKQVMSQVNINQEAKQSVSGYEVISLPKNAANGQVSATLYGNTRTNIAEDITENVLTPGVGATDVGDYIRIGNGSTNVARKVGSYKVNPSTNYTIQIVAKEELGSGKSVKLRFEYLDINKNSLGFSGYSTFAGTTDTLISLTEQMPANCEYVNILMYATACYGYFKKNTLILEETDEVKPYISYGTKSTVSAIRARSVGKNILGGEKFAQNVIKAVGSTNAYKTTVDNRNVLALVGGSAVRHKTVFDKFKENTQYTVQVYAKMGEELTGGYLMLLYTDGTFSNIAPKSTSWEKIVVTSDAGKTIRDLRTTFGETGKINYYDIDTFQIEEGTTATEYEPYKESVAYITAKNPETGEILELHSLPNGTKDEIRVSEGKLIKRVSDKLYLTPDDVISIYDGEDTLYAVASINLVLENAPEWTLNYEGKVYLENWTERQGYAYFNQIPEGYENSYYTREKNRLRICFPKGTTLEQAREQLAGTTLIYQLATPIEIPIQTSGSLVSYPNGTIYIERAVPDAGIYIDKMSVLHQDLPIKTLEKISKVDFDTGLETELDITAAVIAEDKLSFTHPDLVNGDIVFFTYEYDRESTEGETEIEYYDSRYVIKDSVTGKFYKWHLAVADGVPSIKLTEV